MRQVSAIKLIFTVPRGFTIIVSFQITIIIIKVAIALMSLIKYCLMRRFKIKFFLSLEPYMYIMPCDGLQGAVAQIQPIQPGVNSPGVNVFSFQYRY